jgi:outer membrane protein TolC
MDMAQASLQVAQEIPIRGKLGLTHEAARADVARAEAMLARARNRIAAEVALAGLDIYELDRTVRIEIAIRDRFQEMVRAAEGQFAVGRAMQQDLVSMMLEVEDQLPSEGQLRTRFETFVDML